MNEARKLLEFPCDFPLKIMGQQHPEFTATVLSVVREHAPDTQEHQLQTRNSTKGNYLSVTLTVNATSQEQLDNIYRALTSHPMVKVVL